MSIPTIAYDIDPAAVEINYRQCASDHEVNLLPLIADLTNPSPGIGWQNHERMSLLERGPVDAVLALALIHHLAISNNVPLGRIAEFFHQAGQWLVIEFVPKADSQVQRLLATRKDIFTNYSPQGFEEAFKDYFVIRDVQKIPESERCLYLMERK
jgi:ribosomal protein L11 methylase PrmA